MSHRPVHPKIRNVIGPNIQKARVAKGWTQAELARACQLAGWDISREIVVQIEGRKRTMLDYEILLLMDILDIPFESLRPGKSEWRKVFTQTDESDGKAAG